VAQSAHPRRPPARRLAGDCLSPVPPETRRNRGFSGVLCRDCAKNLLRRTSLPCPLGTVSRHTRIQPGGPLPSSLATRRPLRSPVSFGEDGMLCISVRGFARQHPTNVDGTFLKWPSECSGGRFQARHALNHCATCREKGSRGWSGGPNRRAPNP
jgi:hypothetical protein